MNVSASRGFGRKSSGFQLIISNFGRGGMGGNELESAGFSTVSTGEKKGALGCEVVKEEKGVRGFSASSKFEVAHHDGFSVSPGGGMKDFSVESEMAKGKDQF